MRSLSLLLLMSLVLFSLGSCGSRKAVGHKSTRSGCNCGF